MSKHDRRDNRWRGHAIRVALGVAIVFTIVSLGRCATPPPEITLTGARSAAIDATTVAVLPTEDCGDAFLAWVTVDGFGPYRMLLDTGAGVTTITPRVAKQIGSRSRIGLLEIGGFRASGRIPCHERDLTQISRALGSEIDGIVGHPVFHGVVIVYDFPAREVRVHDGRLDAADDGVVPTSRGNRPFIGGLVGDRKIDILIDTGATRGVTLTDLEEYAFVSPLRPTGARVRIDGVHILHSGRLADDLVMGAFTIATPVVHDSVSVNLLGQEAMRGFAVSVDKTNALARFEPSVATGASPIEVASYFGLGLALEPGPDAYEIIDVFDDTPGAAAGIRAGDGLVSIDGIPMSERGCRNPGAELSELSCTIRRDGVDRVVVLRPAALVP